MQGIAAPAGKNGYCKQMNMFFRKNLLTVFCCYRNVTARLYQTMYAYHAHVFCIAGHAKDIGGMLQFRPLNILSQYVQNTLKCALKPGYSIAVEYNSNFQMQKSIRNKLAAQCFNLSQLFRFPFILTFILSSACNCFTTAIEKSCSLLTG